jgi:hypothetical protein
MEELFGLLAASAAGTAVAAFRELVRRRRARAADRRKPSSVELAITDHEGRSITIEVPADNEAALEQAILDVVAKKANGTDSPGPAAT